ncbi:DUF1206 domain-containing protein [Aquimarina sp. ERC-38]|uniref:DUF1206 domain-containing protein n=1 Tax=Aquimarina sp. ERC-38 TaxID=2949996 RepID=UPI002246E5B7|nr:DUF1206 domain-containing protein [Aquimarina sp. ERC-38]UZO80836.1 DUF1206 domain-containing protein [Aquimarina sp. ERC-38]
MNKTVKTTARTGYVAKGVVYTITGALALMTALNVGGQKAGKLQVIDFLEKQSFGKIILGILGLGLVCYAVWRFIQAFQDPEDIGTDLKAMIKRFSFGLSGLFYLGLGIYSIVEIFEKTSSGGSNSSSVPYEYRSYLFIIIGIGLAIKGIYQFIKAYKGDFLDKFSLKSMSSRKRRRSIKTVAYLGLCARGVVVGIVAYFFIKAGMNSSSGSVGGTSEAFSFIQQNTTGSWLYILVTAGLTCYGIYMFFMAKYRYFKD